jgi:hypothetical protein
MGSSRQGCASYEVKVLCRQIARFGRLASPTWREVTISTVLGRKRHGCPGYVIPWGRSDLGGKQRRRPEHKARTAAPQSSLYGSHATEVAKGRAGPKGEKAEAVGEERGTCTPEPAGVGVQAAKERGAERTAGRSPGQQWGGQAARPVNELKAELRGGQGPGPSGRSSEQEEGELL